MRERTLFDGHTIYTVSSLTTEMSETVLEVFPSVIRLRGEVSNLRTHSSGHIYFTLKDDDAQINAIIWRSTAKIIDVSIEDGLELLVEGRIDFYPRYGRYQIICSKVTRVGAGALQEQFEHLFKRLKREGAFDKERIPISRYPKRVGVVTSPTGSVIQDISSVFYRRYPAGELILYPTQVQGIEASRRITEGIKYFNNTNLKPHKVDTIIIARGGGSLEDLWAFNDEIVVRAIYESSIPIVSAIGHETDFTLADYASDMRAGTPSIAAELVCEDATVIINDIAQYEIAFKRYINDKLNDHKKEIDSIVESRAFFMPIQKLKAFKEKQEMLSSEVELKTLAIFEHSKLLHDQLLKRITASSLEAIQKRGFSIVLLDGRIIKDASQLKKGDEVEIRFSDGIKKAIIS